MHGDHIVSVFASTHGVHHTDLSALIHIMDAEAQGAPLTASELQDRLNLTSGATTAVIDRLERLNHATRSRDSADRRKVHLHHSEEAREVGQEFFAPLGMLTAEVLDAFTPEEVDVVIRFLELLSMALRYEGWDVKTAMTGMTAVREAREFSPDVVILDWMLPDVDGLGVLRRMREHDPRIPVLFLTARDAVEDRVAGLTAGGDDYVTKPFSLEEVVARVRALMRRSTITAQDETDSRLIVGDLSLDEDSHEVKRGDAEIGLTATEFELLRYLMRNPKRVLSKSQILDRVWNYDFGGQANVVELYISYLRKKIDAGRAPMIHTVRGVGYVLKPAE